MSKQKLMTYEEWEEEADRVMKAHPKGKLQLENGAEVPDPTPHEPPIGYRPQPSMFEVIRDMIRQEKMRDALAEADLETPEEADDFDVGDDYDPTSPYEYDFDHVADPGELARLRQLIDRRERELRGEADPPPAPGPSAGSPPSPAGDQAPPSGASIQPAGKV